ncbi:RNA-binding domain-containing protein [Dacryopinax primogenitus]|uniref:RNA-binding domain-containing protein n=1 Tax=Dacryopinax primogenitus (strain DJM 731) TaxID=1858805 RepID=M5GC91_DACPD|nr:RNA-binding domain-containing protein [Dacryopinax primogenitus]EJU06115.1 RNA-binding domain-containing protein [Dacryopinax primogenitus]
MNVVKEIQKINEHELQLGTRGSWHDQYKDSAYIFIGGLPYELTEGDVISIFSQYGEPVNVNMPRDKVTGKPKGFAFLMYEDQQSTVLAVDNLNGANIVGRTIRVDHVSKYKNLERGEDGKMKEAEEEQFNAMPQMIEDGGDESEESVSDAPSIDPEDPMRDWLLQRRKEEKAATKTEKKKKRKREHELPEERVARKERKRLKKLGIKADQNVKSISMTDRLTAREPDDHDRKRRHYGEDRKWEDSGRGATYREDRNDRPRDRDTYDDRERRSDRSPRRSPTQRGRSYRDDRR